MYALFMLPFQGAKGGADYLPKALPFQGVALGKIMLGFQPEEPIRHNVLFELR